MLTNPDNHKIVLAQILKAIFSESLIAPILGFKGGTAAMLFYGLDRYSVDLDFDLLDNSKEHLVFETLSKILPKFGEVKEQYKKHHTIFFLVSYAKEIHNVKVEISRRQSGASYELKDYLGISMLVMEQADMAASKLVALLDRRKTANRDIYDVWFFLHNNWVINKGLVEKRMGISFREYLQKAVAFLESYHNKYILAGLGELLNNKQKAWVKSHLKKDALFLLKVKLEMEK